MLAIRRTLAKTMPKYSALITDRALGSRALNPACQRANQSVT